MKLLKGIEAIFAQALLIPHSGIVAEKPSSSLFVTDITGSDNIRQAYRKKRKPLKSDEILSQRTAVPAISTHKRSVHSKTTEGVLEPRSKRIKSNYVPPMECERLRMHAYDDSFTKEAFDAAITPLEDPWAEPFTQKTDTPDLPASFLKKSKPIRAPDTLLHPPVSLLASSRSLPSVPKPKPAHSYNPVFEDWDALLRLEGEKEMAIERTRLSSEAAKDLAQKRTSAAASEPEWDPLLEEESAWEGFESEFEGIAEPDGVKEKRPERKTKAERNKIKRRKEEAMKRKHGAHMMRRDKDAARAKEISSEITAKDAKRKAQDKEIEVDPESLLGPRGDDTELRRRSRLGKHALPPQHLELVLPDELQDSLRLLKPEGNLLRERFRNMQVRGHIEVRRPVKQIKKSKRTVAEKWSYKDFTVTS